MKKYLLIILILFTLFKTTPARADFGMTAFVAGIVIGIAAAEISHYNLDEKRRD